MVFGNLFFEGLFSQWENVELIIWTSCLTVCPSNAHQVPKNVLDPIRIDVKLCRWQLMKLTAYNHLQGHSFVSVSKTETVRRRYKLENRYFVWKRLMLLRVLMIHIRFCLRRYKHECFVCTWGRCMKGSYVPKIHEELHVLESKTTTLPNVLLQSLYTNMFSLGQWLWHSC